MARVHQVITVLLVSWLLVACSSSPPEVPRRTEAPRLAATSTPWVQSQLRFTPAGQTPLEVALDVPDSARLGEPVPLLLRVRNTSAEEITLFTGANVFNFVVLDEQGAEVWTWAPPGAVFPAYQLSITLAPGEVKEFPWLWEQRTMPSLPPFVRARGRDAQHPQKLGVEGGTPVLAGSYTVRGILTTSFSDGGERLYIQAPPRRITLW